MVYTGINNAAIERIKDAYGMPHWGMYAGNKGELSGQGTDFFKKASDIGAIVEEVDMGSRRAGHARLNSQSVLPYDNCGIPF